MRLLLPSGWYRDFLEDLRSLLHAGISLLDALRCIADAGKGKRAQLAQSVHDRVLRGATLAESMAAETSLVPEEHVALIEAGERSGTLVKILARLVERVDRRREATSKLLQLTLYPTSCLVLAVVLLPLYLIFQGRGNAYLLIQAAFFVPFLSLALLLWKRSSLLSASSQARVALEDALLRLPWAGKICFQLAMARAFDLMGLLLEAGMTFDDTLRLSAGTVPWERLRREVHSLRALIKAGRNVSGAFREAPAFASQASWLARITVGEKVGRLDRSFLELGEELEKSAYVRIQRAIRLLPVLLIPLIGAVVLWRALSVLGGIGGSL